MDITPKKQVIKQTKLNSETTYILGFQPEKEHTLIKPIALGFDQFVSASTLIFKV